MADAETTRPDITLEKERLIAKHAALGALMAGKRLRPEHRHRAIRLHPEPHVHASDLASARLNHIVLLHIAERLGSATAALRGHPRQREDKERAHPGDAALSRRRLGKAAWHETARGLTGCARYNRRRPVPRNGSVPAGLSPHTANV